MTSTAGHKMLFLLQFAEENNFRLQNKWSFQNMHRAYAISENVFYSGMQTLLSVEQIATCFSDQYSHENFTH